MEYEHPPEMHDDLHDAMMRGFNELYIQQIAAAFGVPKALWDEPLTIKSAKASSAKEVLEQIRKTYQSLMIEPRAREFEMQFNGAILKSLNASKTPAALISIVDLKIALKLLAQADFTYERQGKKSWYKVYGADQETHCVELFVDTYGNVEPGKVLHF